MLDRARSERASDHRYSCLSSPPVLPSLLECVRSSNTPRRAARQSRHAAFTVGTLLFALSHSLTPQCTSTRRQSLSRSLASLFRSGRATPARSLSVFAPAWPTRPPRRARRRDGGGGRPSLPLSRAGPPPLNPPSLPSFSSVRGVRPPFKLYDRVIEW